MKYTDEFRDAQLIKKALAEVRQLANPERFYRIMEICGGHTHSIFRFGLHGLLPDNVELIHGPGCPVCVLPMGRLDDGLNLANDPNVILATFGDMMRVPGSQGSPLQSKARGADVRMVYSPLDALKIAKQNPDRRVIFFAIGFETTAPSTALTLIRARDERVHNFAVFCNHITIAPAIRALLESPDIELDGFIGPGHVSTVIGCQPYQFIAEEFHRPIAVAGFEPADILHALVMVMRQLNEGRATVECQYTRAVEWEGNRAALEVMAQVFESRDHFEWRGLGSIAHSALAIREEFAAWDAEKVLPVPGVSIADPEEAQCGDVLRGVLKPNQCRLFGKECTPETPIGALMVSSEGSCAAHFKYAGAGSGIDDED